MSNDLLERIAGWQCPTNLWPDVKPFVRVIAAAREDDCSPCNRPQGERINGYVECPDCGLAWPLIEEPEAWESRPFRVLEWGPGTAECIACGIVIVDTFEGAFVLRPDGK